MLREFGPTSGGGALRPVDSGHTPARVSIQGGPTSIHANIVELEHGTGVLGAQGDAALGLSVRAGANGGLMSIAATQSSLAAAVAERTAHLASGLAVWGAEAVVLRDAVHRSAAAYRDVEARAAQAMTSLLAVPALAVAVPLVVTGQEVPGAVSSTVVNAMPELIAMGMNALAPGLGGAFTVVSSGYALQFRDEGRTGPLSATETMFPLIHLLGSAFGVVQLGPVRVAGRTGESRVDLDGSLVDLLELQKKGQDAGPGEIQVAQVATDTPGAPGRVFVVTLPGTQNWMGAEEDFTNPFDGGGILEASVFDSQHVAVGVDEALKQSGAQESDSVVFAGYSQGAMHAMRVAQDDRIRQRYRVEAVKATGGPVKEMPLDHTVEGLELGDGEDITAQAGGRAIHTGPRRTTMTFHGGGLATGKGMGEQHSIDNYLQHARDLEGTESEATLKPTVERFSMLTKGSAVVQTYKLHREARPEPKNPLEPRTEKARRSARGQTSISLLQHIDRERAGLTTK